VKQQLRKENMGLYHVMDTKEKPKLILKFQHFHIRRLQMMCSDTDIKLAIKQGDITIEPFNEDQLGVNSYDVRLGNIFYEVLWDKNGPYFVGPHYYGGSDRVLIPTSGTLLGMTKEVVGTSGKVVAELRSRSTTRRIGVTTNCDAGLGDVGYCDYWTIELTAFISHGKPFLVVGDPVAQMVFYECKSEPTKKYDGQYQAEWPTNMIPREYRHRIFKVRDSD
jgi:dCTP deaminase